MVWEVVISFILTCHSGPYGSIEMNSKSPLSTAIPEAGQEKCFFPTGGQGGHFFKYFCEALGVPWWSAKRRPCLAELTY